MLLLRRSDPARRRHVGAAVAALTMLLTACGSGTPRRQGEPTRVAGLGRGAVVAFVGDSYTTGHGASGPSHRWTSIVAGHFGWAERNLGIEGTGYLARPSYAERLSSVIAAAPAAVVVSGGYNDFYKRYPEPRFRQAVVDTLGQLHRALPHTRIFAVRPFYPAAPPPPALWSAAAKDVRHGVVAAGGTYLDIGSPLNGELDAMSSDHVHPNDSGYSLLARAVERALVAAA